MSEAIIISGSDLSAKLRAALRVRVADLKERTGITPGLAVVLVGEDPASKVYVRNKSKACEELGIHHGEYVLPASISEAELLSLVDELNHSSQYHGILVQAPLPGDLNFRNVVDRISPDKDVDAFHPYNVGKIMIGDFDFLPCTPAGVMELLHSAGITADGKRCVIIGRSNIVGKPLSMLLLKDNGTVTICHSRTQNLAQITRTADILVSAVGKAGFVTGDMIRPGAAVIDVGINRNGDGKLVGDVDFESAKNVAGYITPVPGGVGPMTVTMLMENTVRAAERFATKL